MKNRILISGLILAMTLVFLTGKASSAKPRAGKPGADRKGTLSKAENMKIIKLRNGVQAIIEENHSAPVVALQIWVKAGSGDESDSQAGIAHLIEHMMFKGSEKFPDGELSNAIETKGGQLNAFTTSDFTVYHTVMSSRFYETGLEQFSDALLHPKFDPQELDREREVVLEEIRRQEDNPRNKLYDQLMKLSYSTHPYRRPVIGFQDTVSGFEHEQLMHFYDCNYRTGNMIVVLVGDFDAGSAAANVKKYFGEERKEEPCSDVDQRAIKEPEQKELKVRLSLGQVSRGYVYLAYKIPEFGDQDMAALDLLSSVLGQGESSRLTETVRNSKKLVDEIFVYSNTPRGPGQIMIGATLDPKNLIPASQEIISQLNRVKQGGIEDWELARAKRQIESDSIYSRETMEGNARRVGFFDAIIDDPGYEKKYLDDLEKVTAADVSRVAQKYLALSRLAYAGMMPEGTLKQGTEDNLRLALLDANGKTVAPGAVSAKPAVKSEKLWPLPPEAPNQTMVAEPKQFTLKNGIRVIVRENHYVPLVSVRAGFPGGVRFEQDSDNGIFNLLAEMLTEGTMNMNAETIHRQIESLAANIAGFSGRNSFGLTLTVPSPNFDQSLGLFAKLLSEPSFPKSDLERIRGLVLAGLKREQDQPRILVNNLFYKTLYTQHPYRLNPQGSEESLKKLKREDLLNAYRKFAASGDLVIAISGDVKADEVRSQLEQDFADFNRGTPDIAAPAAEPSFSSPRTSEQQRKGAQTQIVFGWLGTTLSSADQPAIEVLSEILSGMSGRLFVELRDKKSLAYEISAYHLEGLEPGYIAGYIGCAPEKRQEATDGMLAEFIKLKNEPVSEEEITRSKNALIGAYEIDLQNNMGIATHMFFDELYDLGFNHWQGYAERINKVGWKDIQSVANKYLTDGYALAIIDPPAETKKP